DSRRKIFSGEGFELRQALNGDMAPRPACDALAPNLRTSAMTGKPNECHVARLFFAELGWLRSAWIHNRGSCPLWYFADAVAVTKGERVEPALLWRVARYWKIGQVRIHFECGCVYHANASPGIAVLTQRQRQGQVFISGP